MVLDRYSCGLQQPASSGYLDTATYFPVLHPHRKVEGKHRLRWRGRPAEPNGAQETLARFSAMWLKPAFPKGSVAGLPPVARKITRPIREV